jgi:hypothetical protein
VRHECDCGSVYSSSAAVIACADSRHGQRYPRSQFDLPDFGAVYAKAQRGEKLNPLEAFVFENEPAGRPDDEEFRDGLAAAIRFVI